ncbi:MAG TPA: patatin-like phospholipase family protein [Bryobacteraceae bacterium]|nr:patatin-like phospholipase family protein [Bryobacteraceae bacterium]
MIKILSIDGGGIRGIIPAVLLAEIEERTGRPIAELFDLVAGTSTGGILALGLTIPKARGAPLYTAQNLVQLYEREGGRIFARSWLRTLFTCDSLTWKKYASTGIEQVLLEYFGDSRLRDAVTDVLVTSYEVERRFPFFFKSSNARQRLDYDFPAREVARATSAAPTYFEPMKLLTGTNSDHYTLIDGGVFANNPAACALVEARTTFPGAGAYLVVSLGTGTLMRNLPLAVAKYWGSVRWAKPLIDIVFDGVSSTVDYQLRELVPDSPNPGKLYYRFQVQLNGHDALLDNASAENITALKNLAYDLIERESEDIDSVCEKLTRKD